MYLFYLFILKVIYLLDLFPLSLTDNLVFCKPMLQTPAGMLEHCNGESYANG